VVAVTLSLLCLGLGDKFYLSSRPTEEEDEEATDEDEEETEDRWRYLRSFRLMKSVVPTENDQEQVSVSD